MERVNFSHLCISNGNIIILETIFYEKKTSELYFQLYVHNHFAGCISELAIDKVCQFKSPEEDNLVVYLHTFDGQ